MNENRTEITSIRTYVLRITVIMLLQDILCKSDVLSEFRNLLHIPKTFLNIITYLSERNFVDYGIKNTNEEMKFYVILSNFFNCVLVH